MTLSHKPKGYLLKRIKLAIFVFVALLFVSSPIALLPISGSLNVYNWADYIPKHIIHKFERETGIRVNYAEYDNNETMYAKLRTNPQNGYDVVVPSSYFIERMTQQDMLHTIDFSKIPNSQHLNPLLMHGGYDPKNQHSLPIVFGTTGIMVNDLYYDPRKITGWSDFWKPEFKNELMILNDVREVFAVSLRSLGMSVNARDPEEIRKAYLHLKELVPNIKLFDPGAGVSIYTDEDAWIGMIYSGAAYSAMQENAHLHYIYPKEGAGLWVDCYAIPKNAPHLENAYKFINYMLRPDINVEIIKASGYSSANLKAMQSLPPELRDNKVLNPDQSLLQGAESIQDVGGKAKGTYEHYWQLFKISS